MAVQYQPIPISFTAGLDTKSNPQASKPPSMDVLQNIEFDQVSGYQKRKPFGAMPNAIQGGGALANMRGIFEHRGELCVFSSDTLYSYAEQAQVWVPKGTHLAGKITDTAHFASLLDIIEVDRAEINNTVVYVWSDANALNLYIAAIDKLSSAVIVAPQIFQNFGNRPRITALSATFMITAQDGSTSAANLVCWQVTPAAIATGNPAFGAPVVIAAEGVDQDYDVARVGATDSIIVVNQLTPTTHYTITTISSALAITATVTKARASVGPIAISIDPVNATCTVLRSATTVTVRADVLALPALGDLFVDLLVGGASGTIEQIAACHEPTLTGGFYRCRFFYSATDHNTLTNWVDSGGTIGVQANFVATTTVASRPFVYNGVIFVWLSFAESGSGVTGFNPGPALQNVYFLYRADAFLCGKAVYDQAGGGWRAGYLPNVTSVTAGTYTFAGLNRRLVPLLGDVAYANRSPHEVTVSFDSNEARRGARLGDTRYIVGGELLQYDSVQLAEVGFHVYPWDVSLTPTGAGSMANGPYAYRVTNSYTNANGEQEESTTATAVEITIAGGPAGTVMSAPPGNHITHKQNISVNVYRTTINPIDTSSYYLVTDNDPGQTVNPNRYLNNVVSGALVPVFDDALADGSITARRENPDNGSVLERVSPPASTIILKSNDRLFLAGIAGAPDTIWYSRARGDGEIASFNDALTFTVPPGAGPITGMEFLNETLIVFRSHACFAYAGLGFDNAGGGQNFSGTRISPDIGAVSADGIARIENAILFKSSKGWYRVDQNLQLTYVGAAVAKFDADTPLSSVVMETQHQVRCLTSGRMLVWDTLVNNWAEWTIADGLGSCLWQGQHVYLTATGPKIQQLDFTGVNYGFVVEMAFLTPADLQGSSHVCWLALLGEYRGDHKLQTDVCRDYLQDGAGNWLFLNDPIKVYTPSPAIVGSAYQVRHGPSVVKYQAIKVRFTELLGAGGVWTEGARLTGVTFSAGSDGKLWPYLPASQKA